MNYNNKYIGMRYVPKFHKFDDNTCEWSSLKASNIEFEHLEIVTYEGNSYTSTKAVPMGIDIGNREFWVETGNYNAQLQEYINRVDTLQNEQYNIYLNSTQTINAKTHHIPTLNVMVDDGITDNAPILNNIIQYAIANNIQTIFIPYTVNAYKCNSEVHVDISKVNIIGDNARFDFANNTDSNCFHIFGTSGINDNWHLDRWNIEHIFQGIVIGKVSTWGTSSVPFGTGIKIDADYEACLFKISKCTFVGLVNGIEIGNNAWRFKVDWCNFMFNTKHLYCPSTVTNTGENLMYSNIMFSAGSIDYGCDGEFINCSFDNTNFIQRNNNAKFTNCHFEILATSINTFLQNEGEGCISCMNCDFTVNVNAKISAPLFINNGIDSERAIYLNNCYLSPWSRIVDQTAFKNAHYPFAWGYGKIVAKNVWGYKSNPVFPDYVLPMCSYANQFVNGDAQHPSGIIPLISDTNAGSNDTCVIENITGGFASNKAFHVTVDMIHNSIRYVELDVESGQVVTYSLVAKVNANGGSGGCACKLSTFDRNNQLVSDNIGYNTLSDTNGAFVYDALNQGNRYVVEEGVKHVRLYLQTLNNGSQHNTDAWFTDIIYNAI